MKLLNEILGTKYPIIQGGMANIATGEFAAACSNAGALGIIGAGGMNADTLRQNIRRCRELTDKPFGVNIMLMHPQADEFAQIVVEEKVAVVTTGAGNPGKYVSMWKAAGIKVIPVVAAAVLARHLEPLGIDAVIAEGTESGGHVGEMTTMALVPQVRQAVDLPLIAAGGIATGAGMLAAFALGAEGCQLGTRFALSRESSACEAFKRRCVEVQEGGTILTLKKVIPTRLVRNGFCRTVEEAESRGATAEELLALIGRGRPKRGIFEGDLDEGELEIGQIAALIEDLPPAGEILRRLVADGVIVYRTEHSAYVGIVSVAVFLAYHFLQNHRHLLLVDDIARCRHIRLGVFVIHRGVNALDGGGEHLQHLLLVFEVRNHIG